MRVIYYSYWGTYAAYLMAALHAGIYPADAFPSEELIMRQYELCRRYAGQYGNLIYIGTDEKLNEVYSVGCRQHGAMVVRAISNIDLVFRINEPLHFVNAKDQEGLMPFILQNIIRMSGKTDEEKLFAGWFRRHYKTSSELVGKVKQSLNKM